MLLSRRVSSAKGLRHAVLWCFPLRSTGCLLPRTSENTTFPRTSVNRLRALLRTSPLHTVDHLLRIGRELLKTGWSCLYHYCHRLTIHIFQHDEAEFFSLLYTRRGTSDFVEETKVRTVIALGDLRDTGNYGIELHAL